MVRSTQIARISDSLPLAQSVDDAQTGPDLAPFKQQARMIFRKLTPSSETRCSIDSGPMTLHYLISPRPPDPRSVVYLTITDRSYPRKLAFAFLDELAREFDTSYGGQIAQRTLRPYAFVAFDTFMQRTKRLYADSRTAEAAASTNLDRLNEDLQDVQKVMTKNMEDLLWRGDSLDHMSTMSSSLRDESLRYRRAARKINIDAMVRKWAPGGKGTRVDARIEPDTPPPSLWGATDVPTRLVTGRAAALRTMPPCPRDFDAMASYPRDAFPAGIGGSAFTPCDPDERDADTGVPPWSAARLAVLQRKLNQPLGPEYLSQRPGPGAGTCTKLTYVEGWRVVDLANEVFGFNGWSTSITSLDVDFLDVDPGSGRCNCGVSAIVRISLRDGSFHEDVGYGHVEGMRGKHAALEKSKKEAVTDSIKRGLKTFGRLLGNCLYDRSYSREVMKMPAQPIAFDANELHRHQESRHLARDAPGKRRADDAHAQAAKQARLRQAEVARAALRRLREKGADEERRGGAGASAKAGSAGGPPDTGAVQDGAAGSERRPGSGDERDGDSALSRVKAERPAMRSAPSGSVSAAGLAAAPPCATHDAPASAALDDPVRAPSPSLYVRGGEDTADAPWGAGDAEAQSMAVDLYLEQDMLRQSQLEQELEELGQEEEGGGTA
ncbi:SNAP receptor [Malassezia sp. CBS 17886]|nr:SNAP receptor [Malassezia sp. CBS 17886]